MTKQECVQRLSAPCFWDTDRETFDLDQYPAFIVSRVFEIGTLSDWRLLVSYFGDAEQAPMPVMLTSTSWETMKTIIRKSVIEML